MRVLAVVVAVLMVTSMVVLAQPAERPGKPDAPGAVKIELMPTSEMYEDLSGFVILNQPNGKDWYNAVIQVRGFEPEAWVAWGVGLGDRVGEFQCDSEGNGGDTIKLDEIGGLINVKWLDGPGGDGPVVLSAPIP